MQLGEVLAVDFFFPPPPTRGAEQDPKKCCAHSLGFSIVLLGEAGTVASELDRARPFRPLVSVVQELALGRPFLRGDSSVNSSLLLLFLDSTQT